MSGLRHHFGASSAEVAWCIPPSETVILSAFSDPARVAAREVRRQTEKIDHVHAGLKTIIEKYEVLGPIAAASASGTAVALRAFVSHGGIKHSLSRVEGFLRALGIEPIVVERSASEGREVHENVDHYRSAGDFAVVIWTKDVEVTNGGWLPSGSVAMEAGELRERFGQHIIFLAEKGVMLPTLGKTIVYEEFSEDDIGPAFQKIVIELRAWGWLRVAPADG